MRNTVIDSKYTLKSAREVNRLLQNFERKCCKNCTIASEIALFKQKLTKIQKSIIHLEKLLHVRNKRGAFNFIGISKTLFGILDSKDLDIVNQNIDELFTANNNIIVHNQTAIIKLLLNSSNAEAINKVMTKSNKHYDITNRNIQLTAQPTTIEVLLLEVQANVEVLL